MHLNIKTNHRHILILSSLLCARGIFFDKISLFVSPGLMQWGCLHIVFVLCSYQLRTGTILQHILIKPWPDNSWSGFGQQLYSTCSISVACPKQVRSRYESFPEPYLRWMCCPHQVIQVFHRRGLHTHHYHLIHLFILQVAMVVAMVAGEPMLRKHRAKKEALSFVWTGLQIIL
jgi:hypothetical protein